ncbi:MAG: MDR family NADPH-dependent oxidoreductase, partial [Akkermansiaceae bacterium]
RVLASPINPADVNYIQGIYGIVPDLPAAAGMEGCGEIIESCADTLSVGDLVIFGQYNGVWASEVVCRPDALLKIPNDTPTEQAAMLKVNPLTSWCMLTQFVDLPKGSWVIQNAANSGVGVCVIQIAKLLGLKTINLVRRDELIDDLVKLGGDIVLLDNAESISEIKQHAPQLALNAVGGDSALRLMDALAPEGIHVTYGAMSRRSLKVPNKFLIFKRIQLHGFWMTEWIKKQPREHVEEIYQLLAQWMAQGDLTQPIDSKFPLGDIISAVTRAQEDKRQGKVMLMPQEKE